MLPPCMTCFSCLFSCCCVLTEPRFKLHRLPLLWQVSGWALTFPAIKKCTSGLEASTLVRGNWGSASGLPAAPKKPQVLATAPRDRAPGAELSSQDGKGSQVQTWKPPSQRPQTAGRSATFFRRVNPSLGLLAAKKSRAYKCRS